ncbi:MAG: crotonase/enoyl-CoA hydratase family protein [Actinobacteria bacterium]|nr:crotonase/enoyl-CoA hydratase family protein [Actinomycetota bacterium]
MTVSDGTAIIDLDDGKANALGFSVLDGLDSVLTAAEEDPSVTAVAMIGRPGRFSAGFDLAVMTSGPEQARTMLGRGAEVGLRLYTFPKPVVLGVTGHALAMGAILLCCADVRIGADGPYKLGLNEVAIGMPVPAFAVGVCETRLALPAFTRAIQLAHIHTPAEALAAGFLDELVTDDQVRDRAVAVANDLGERLHPGPFRATRRTVRSATADRLRSDLERDLALFDVSG